MCLPRSDSCRLNSRRMLELTRQFELSGKRERMIPALALVLILVLVLVLAPVLILVPVPVLKLEW